MAIGQILCAFSSANTGKQDCVFYPSPDRYLLAVPKGFTFDGADFVNFKSTLIALLQNADPNARGYLFGEFNGFTATDQERATATADDGSIFTTRDPIRMLQYVTKGSDSCLQKTMKALDNSQTKFDFYRINDKGYMVGQAVFAESSPYALEMGGYSAQNVYLHPRSEALYSDTANSILDFNFLNPKADQFKEIPADTTNINWAQMAATYGVSNVKINLTATPSVAGQYKFTLEAGCGNTTISKVFAATGAQLTANYKVTTDAGANVAISSISVNATTGEVTLSAVTPPSTGTVVIIELNGLVTLPTGGLRKFETPASSFDGTIANGLDVYKLTVESA